MGFLWRGEEKGEYRGDPKIDHHPFPTCCVAGFPRWGWGCYSHANEEGGVLHAGSWILGQISFPPPQCRSSSKRHPLDVEGFCFLCFLSFFTTWAASWISPPPFFSQCADIIYIPSFSPIFFQACSVLSHQSGTEALHYDLTKRRSENSRAHVWITAWVAICANAFKLNLQ